MGRCRDLGSIMPKGEKMGRGGKIEHGNLPRKLTGSDLSRQLREQVPGDGHSLVPDRAEINAIVVRDMKRLGLL